VGAPYLARFWRDVGNESALPCGLSRACSLGPERSGAGLTQDAPNCEMDQAPPVGHHALGRNRPKPQKLPPPNITRRLRLRQSHPGLHHLQSGRHALSGSSTADLSTALGSGQEDKVGAMQWPILHGKIRTNTVITLSSRPERSAVERSAVYFPAFAQTPANSATPSGCPTFAPAYVGRKRRAKPHLSSYSRTQFRVPPPDYEPPGKT